MPTKMRFEAKTVAATAKAFAFFPRFSLDASKDAFAHNFTVYREEMRKRSTVGPLFKNTGRLGGSYDREIAGGVLSQLRASVFSHSSYSVVHERGGTVFPPRGSSWIFIPTVFNALYTLRAHVRRPKRTVKQVRTDGGKFVSLKEFVRTVPDATRTLSLMDYKSRSLLIDAHGIPMFTMVKRAHYAARLEFFKTGEKYEQFIMDDIANRQLSYWEPQAGTFV